MSSDSLTDFEGFSDNEMPCDFVDKNNGSLYDLLISKNSDNISVLFYTKETYEEMMDLLKTLYTFTTNTATTEIGGQKVVITTYKTKKLIIQGAGSKLWHNSIFKCLSEKLTPYQRSEWQGPQLIQPSAPNKTKSKSTSFLSSLTNKIKGPISPSVPAKQENKTASKKSGKTPINHNYNKPETKETVNQIKDNSNDEGSKLMPQTNTIQEAPPNQESTNTESTESEVTALKRENRKMYEQSKLLSNQIQDLRKENESLKILLANAKAQALIAEEEMKKLKEKNMQETTKKSNEKKGNIDEKVLTQMFDAIDDLRSQTDYLKQEISSLKSKPTYAAVTACQILPTPVLPTGENTSHAGNSAASPKHGFAEHSRNPDKSPPKQRAQTRKSTLLLGDSIIQKLNPKGLSSSVHKHAIPGGTIKDILNDVHSFNLCQFNTVVIYIGGNDLARTTDHELTEELYDQLITHIKACNPVIKLVLCKIAPRGDVDVNILNMIVQRLGVHHQVMILDIFRDFHDKSGKLQMRFMGQQDPVHPSPSGIKRIAGSIHQKVHLVDDFTKCTYQAGRAQNNPQISGSNGYPRNNLHRNNQKFFHSRCMNCSGTNHRTSECRFKQAIKCWSCGLSGHKQEACWNSL